MDVHEHQVSLNDLETLQPLRPDPIREQADMVVQAIDEVAQLGVVHAAHLCEDRREEGRDVAEELRSVQIWVEVVEERAEMGKVAAARNEAKIRERGESQSVQGSETFRREGETYIWTARSN